jgi:hypothetical protein
MTSALPHRRTILPLANYVTQGKYSAARVRHSVSQFLTGTGWGPKLFAEARLPKEERMTKRRFLGALTALILCAGATREANAGFGIGGSLGTGFVHMNGDTSRIPFNLEIMPFYKVSIISADLGMVFGFESPYNVQFRPGVRVSLWLLYLRAAIPLTANNGGDYGFLFGVGTSFGVGPVGVFIEADTNLSHTLGFGNAAPIEFRAGVQFSF